MALPKFTDLVLYVSKAITGADWNTNWQKLVTWLTSGTTDIKVGNVEASSMTNNGALNCDSLNVTNPMATSEISGNLNVGGVISGDGSGLTGIVSTSTIAWTPFTVNKGYLDNSGNEILMQRKLNGGVYTLVTFENNITENFPLTATTSDGITFTLEQIDDLDCSNQQDGTFTICVKKGQIKAEIKESVYRQRVAPTSVPENTLWLDTSVENIQCYERKNNAWVKYDGVPIGEIVVSGSVVTTVSTYHYNWNGYNINVQEEINIYQRPAVVIKSYKSGNNWYRVYSDGFVEQGGKVTFPSGAATQTKTVTYHIALASNPLSINLTPVPNNSYYADHWYVESFGSSSMVVASGVIGSHETALLWEVKGYK